MAAGLAEYLAEFEATSPSASQGTRASLSLGPYEPLIPREPLITGAPTLVNRLPAAYAAAAIERADQMVAEGVLPSRPAPGGSVMRPMPDPAPPPPSTASAWTAEMWAVHGEINSLESQVTRLRAGGTLRSARAANPDAHIQNNYYWREYAPPASANCDPSQLVWLDVWFRAKQLLSRMAVAPVPGVAAVSVRLWSVNVQRLATMLVESTNTRFFGGRYASIGRLNIDWLPALASTAQGRGTYDYDRRGDTAAQYQTMSFAPVPAGGLEELFTGPQAAWLRRRPELTCLGHSCDYRPIGGVTPSDAIATGDAATWSATSALGQAFAAWGATGQTVFDLQVYPRGTDRSHLVPARLDIGAFMENTLNRARVLADPRLSIGEVIMRSTNFYLNAYLDYAERKGVLPTEVVNNARAAWAGVQGAANDALNATVGTASGIVTAIVSAINGAAGAVVGVVLAIVALLIALGGAAVGTGPFVPLPYYLRSYSGSCEDRSWAPAPTTPPRTTPLPSDAVVSYYPPTPPDPPSGGKAIGFFGLAAGLWLLLGRK